MMLLFLSPLLHKGHHIRSIKLAINHSTRDFSNKSENLISKCLNLY